MIQIQDSETSQLNHDHQSKSAGQYIAQHPTLDLPFRSYFLLAVACSIFALAVWAAYFNGLISFANNGITPVVWHIHEMLFGFAATVAVGFILTAAQTWTGLPSIKGLPILAFIVLWLLVRITLLINTPNSIVIAVVLQSFWWLGSIAIFARLVMKSGNRRNYLFIPLLSALMLLNIALILLDLNDYHQLTRHIARTCVLMFCLLMGILGGRVIPFFTVSGARLAPINTPLWITPLLIATSISGVLAFFSSTFISLPFSPAILMISSGLLHLLRQSYWRSAATVNIALLWSLHLAYFSLGLGLLLLGLSYFPQQSYTYLGGVIIFSDALHLITIAAMGLMIFAMMCRVSLGHTGRSLTPKKLVSWIFLLIMLSALSRTFLALLTYQPLLAWNISAFSWFVAGLIFIRIYFPILTTKKIVKSFPAR